MDTQAVITHIARWLDEYAAQANVKGFVVGVSGGIDSAVVSALAARTGRTTLLLDMPIRQHPDQLERARLHIRNLQRQYANVSAQTVDLTDTFQTFEQTVGVHQTAFDNQPLSLANARSRLRMLTLYYYGQIHGLLVTGTGNKIEDFGVGFFTKYGDGGVDISPIADLTKTQVYRLAESLNIIEAIRKAVPTDGLWDTERTDEQQMGASYPELEWAMDIPADKQPEDFEGRQREVLAIYRRLNRAAQHKIQPIPVCNVPKEWLA